MTFNGTTLNVTGNVTTTSTTSNSIGGVTLSNGYVGIGTSADPTFSVDAASILRGTSFFARNADANSNAVVQITSNGNGAGNAVTATYASYVRSTTLRTDIRIDAVNNTDTRNLAYFDGTNIRMGINNNAPSYTLDVNGTARATTFLTTVTTNSNYIGGVTLSNSILTVGAATAGSTTSGSVNVAGGFFINGVALTGGSTISGTTTTGTVLLATGTSTGLQGSSNLTFSNGSNLGIQTTTPATALDVNGGVTIRNGYRPTYSNVSSGTSFTVPSAAYGTHFNITASSITGITLPTVTGSTDSNAYWVFRNNTAGYLSITFTYTTAGTTYPANPVTIPPANSLTMMVTYPSSVLGYVLF